MKAPQVDFAPPLAWPVAVGWVCAGLAAVACALSGIRYSHAWEASASARDQTGRLARQIDALHAARSALAASAAEPAPFAADAARLTDWSSVDAAGVLRSIETAQVAGAKVAEIDIDASTRTAELRLDVTSADMATAYLAALNAGDARSAWTLVRVQSQGAAFEALIRGEIR